MLVGLGAAINERALNGTEEKWRNALGNGRCVGQPGIEGSGKGKTKLRTIDQVTWRSVYCHVTGRVAVATAGVPLENLSTQADRQHRNMLERERERVCDDSLS